MKKKNIIFISVLLLVVAISSICFMLLNKKNNANDKTSKKSEDVFSDNIVQTKEMSSESNDYDEFMKNYFEEMKTINSNEEKDNMLIVISSSKIANTYGAKKIIEAPNNQYILQYSNKNEKENALKELRKDNSITVEENITRKITGTNYKSWGIEKTGLDYAIETSNTRSLNKVTVAIIDTGCDIGLLNCYFSDKIEGSYNVLDSESDMTDKVGHGTHIAGTIAEGTPDNVKIFPIKVSNNSDIYTTDIIEAINYIVYYDKADVINMSYGGYEYSEAEYQTVESANQKGIICVAAAGNDNYAIEHYPSSFDNTISISAVDSDLNKADFSNHGSTITFTAPGVDILSINGTMSGTSMATPHATSAIAILKSNNNKITLDNTIDILKKYAIDLGDDGWDQYYGYGLINFKGTQFANGEETDKYGIFKNDVMSKIEAIDFETINYNYGNVTNLMNAKINLYYNETDFYTKSLWELEDVQIIGYEPYSYTDQNVTIKYQNKETILKVNNKNAVSDGWGYSEKDDGTISLYSFIHTGVEYPLKVYIPSKIDGYTVSDLQPNLFSSRRKN